MSEFKGKKRELRCKNDDCRNLLGMENIKVGILEIVCKRCKNVNLFRFSYSQMREEFDTLINIVEYERG